MSTRAQVLIEDTGVYLYQHYDGYDLDNIVMRAIARGERLDDVEYLTRIIFSEMIRDYIDEPTGFGIGTCEHSDIEYLVIVNVAEQTMELKRIYEKGGYKIKFKDIV